MPMPEGKRSMNEQEIKKFIDDFKYYNVKSDGTYVREDIKRKYLAHYVNVAKDSDGNVDSDNAKWEILGYKVEDASVEFNWEDEVVTDITGTTYKSITKSEPTISLDGYIINTESKFLEDLSKKAIRNAYNEFSNYEILSVFYWFTKKDTNTDKTLYLAKKETGCNISPTSIGGEGYVRISPTITLSNNAKWGTVEQEIGSENTKFEEELKDTTPQT